MNLSIVRKLVLILVPLFGTVLYGQQHANVERGFAADKVYQFGNIDSVNVYNGNLTISIPIGLRYPNNGGMTYGLTLSYNSKLWSYDQGYCQTGVNWGCNTQVDGTEVPNAYTRSTPSRRSNTGFGWLLSLGRLIDPDDVEATVEETDQDLLIEGFYEWIYESPDGNDHRWAGKPAGTGAGTPLDTNVAYTTDGSYLRMRTMTATKREIDFPDGSIHTFEKLNLPYLEPRYRITRMQDAFGNAVGISYPDALRWVLTDQFGRVQTVHFRVINNAQKNYRKIVDRVVLSSFNGVTATWQFTYNEVTSVKRPVPGPSNLPGTTTVPTLTAIQLPDGATPATSSTFSFQYYDVNYAQSGPVRTLTLPTKGVIEYEYRWFEVGAGVCHQLFLDSTAGLAKRTFKGINGEADAVWAYQPDVQPGVICDVCPPPPDTVLIDPQDERMIRQPRKELIVTVSAPDKNKTKHYFSVFPPLNGTCGTGNQQFTGWEFGLPFSREWPVSRPATNFNDVVWLSTETFDCAGSDTCPDASAVPPRPKRSSYLKYESATEDYNWRPAGRRTVFHDDSNHYVDSISTSFDGYGNYRSERVSGSFGTERVSVTNYNPSSIDSVGRVSPDGPLAIPPNAKWILGKHDSVTTTEGSATQKSAFCFDTDGFLKGRRVMKNIAGPEDKDVLTIFTPEVDGGGRRTGNVSAEEWFGGDTGSALYDTCQITGSGRYRINYTYQYGVQATSQYNGVTFKSLDLTINPSTGLAQSYRDAAGIQTDYDYDKLGRITWLKPTGQAWTEYEYKRAGDAPGYLTAAVNVRQRPSGSTTGSPLAESKFVFDSFGRVWRELTLIDSAWVMRDTTLNAMGQKWKVSEQIPEQAARPTTKITKFENYDPFGRAWKVTGPDNSVTDFSFKGERERERTQRSIRGLTANIDALTRETYDHHGRMTTVTETEPSTITTTYQYDVANRLISVNMQGQQRAFNYDNRGFLIFEKHPEVRSDPATDITGTISYGSYDAKGHPGSKTYDYALAPNVTPGSGSNFNYATFDLKYEYDSAERLIRVWSKNPNYYCPGCGDPQQFRILKQFMFGEGAFSGDRSRGKVQKAVRHNHQPGLGDIVVTDTYKYGETEPTERAGRLTSKETEVGKFSGSTASMTPSPPNTQVIQAPTLIYQSFKESYAYTDLSDNQQVTYPNCTFVGCGATTTAAITNGYLNGRLNNVAGYANSINYHPSGMVSSIYHSNGVVLTQTQDSSGMPRPASISTANVIACDAPVITQQPLNTMVPPNTSTRLSVMATGSGVLSYQWYEGNVGDASLPVNSTFFYFDTPPLTQTKKYWVWIKNNCGSAGGGKMASAAGGGDAPMAVDDTVGAVFSNNATITIGTLGTPTSLVATAATTTSVSLTWVAASGATSYEVERKNGAGAFARVGTPASTSFSDTTAVEGVGYIYRVRAMAGATSSPYSNSDLATTVIFTDPTLTVGSTPIKAAHFTELRTAVNAVRASSGLTAAVWTDVTLAGVTVKSVHLTELRTKINEALTALGFAAPAYTDPTITVGTTLVNKVHVDELRLRVK